MKIKVLIKKEIFEIFKTSKIYVLPIIFLFFGITSPLMTQLLPDILKNLPGGIKISLPEQTWADSFMQFFKNLNQIGIISIILVFMGTVSDEKSRGTAIMVLTKPVSRVSFVISKFFTNSLLAVFAIFLGYITCLFYTLRLFPSVNIAASLSAILIFTVSSVFYIAIITGLSAIFKSNIAAGGITLGIYFFFSLLPFLGGWFSEYSPGCLVNYQNKLLVSSVETHEVIITILVFFIISSVILSLGIKLFNTEEI
jgi:ABC-2 type transport system permease protein